MSNSSALNRICPFLTACAYNKVFFFIESGFCCLQTFAYFCPENFVLQELYQFPQIIFGLRTMLQLFEELSTFLLRHPSCMSLKGPGQVISFLLCLRTELNIWKTCLSALQCEGYHVPVPAVHIQLCKLVPTSPKQEHQEEGAAGASEHLVSPSMLAGKSWL